MKTFILGIDESDEARRALERAADLAKALDARVIVTSVAPVMQFVARGTGPYDPTDPPERHRQLAADAAAVLSERDIAAKPVTGFGDAGDVIVELAEKHDADLIVVGMSHHPALARIFGGVSEDVAHHSHCDVLLVH